MASKINASNWDMAVSQQYPSVNEAFPLTMQGLTPTHLNGLNVALFDAEGLDAWQAANPICLDEYLERSLLAGQAFQDSILCQNPVGGSNRRLAI